MSDKDEELQSLDELAAEGDEIDFDAAADLSYTIKMSSSATSKVTLSIQGTMLSASTVVPNWNGEVVATCWVTTKTKLILRASGPFLMT